MVNNYYALAGNIKQKFISTFACDMQTKVAMRIDLAWTFKKMCALMGADAE